VGIDRVLDKINSEKNLLSYIVVDLGKSAGVDRVSDKINSEKNLALKCRG
jgi:hypothetical protein